MTKGKILLGPSSFGAASPAPVALLQAAGYEVVDNPFKRRLTREELLGLLPGIKGLIAGLEPLDRDVLEKSELKALARVGSGMSNVDMPAAQDLGIHVSSTPDGPTLAVAELTVGCLMNLLRQTSAMDRAMRAGDWDKRMGRQLRDLTIAIVGYGRIGRKTGELFSALGAKIQIVDPFVDAASVSAPVVSLEQALEGADAIALHASGETCIIDAAAFERMKPGMFLLNAARGELIDYDALFPALGDGRVAGIWADAHPQEPYKGKLLEFDQALLTPHIGSYALEGRIQMELDAAQNLLNDLDKAS
ncbi:NAD(P)-dependent oxidoreductase [Maricaulis sp.]|uniref:NAD(P)-dependent oxidoreductase n=1 Tax=Maricaulis sp. TaxID=1486257 RepID=UPI003A92CF57